MNKIEKRPEGVGRKLLKIIACSVFLVFSVFQSHLAFATGEVPVVTISVNELGETIILMPNGETLYKAGISCTFEFDNVIIKAFIDPDTDKAEVTVVTGTIHVVVGSITTRVPKGSTIAASVDTETGEAEVKNISIGDTSVEVIFEGQTVVTLAPGESYTKSIAPPTPGGAQGPPGLPKPEEHSTHK